MSERRKALKAAGKDPKWGFKMAERKVTLKAYPTIKYICIVCRNAVQSKNKKCNGCRGVK